MEEEGEVGYVVLNIIGTEIVMYSLVSYCNGSFFLKQYGRPLECFDQT